MEKRVVTYEELVRIGESLSELKKLDLPLDVAIHVGRLAKIIQGESELYFEILENIFKKYSKEDDNKRLVVDTNSKQGEDYLAEVKELNKKTVELSYSSFSKGLLKSEVTYKPVIFENLFGWFITD